jgi:glucose/arabinose dehydrogenase
MLNSNRFELAPIIIVVFTFMPLTIGSFHELIAQTQIDDSNLKVEILTEGLSEPTSMAFLDETSILVTEKEGLVRLISNGVLNQEPVLNVDVRTESERGLLGIDIQNGKQVYFYFSQAISDGSVMNRIYKYDWDGKQLINPIHVLDLPGEPGPNHDGGKLLISHGPENALYAVIGDLNHDGQLQNLKDGPPPDNTSVIIRLNYENGSAAEGNPFKNISNGDVRGGSGGNNNAMSKYFAYGIRNSFGLAIDPVTGILWDTENGASMFDEINIVRPGFNSGWKIVMGPIAQEGATVEDLVMFPGAHYKDPLLSWRTPPALTAIEFLNSTKLGDKYTNNLFVGDYNGGNLYFFTLNEQRDDLNLNSFSPGDALSDRVVDTFEEQSAITFGTGFGSITDIKTGPDGFLYILSYGDGRMYRISPS